MMKLWKIELQSMGGSEYNPSFVVAEDSKKAYEKVRKYLDEKDYGFVCGRELKSVTLVADEKEYCNCKTRLFL